VTDRCNTSDQELIGSFSLLLVTARNKHDEHQKVCWKILYSLLNHVSCLM